MDFIKIKNICCAKNSAKKIKRQDEDWEKMFAYQIDNEELVSRIYNKCLKIQL